MINYSALSIDEQLAMLKLSIDDCPIGLLPWGDVIINYHIFNRDHEWQVLRKTRNSSVNVCVAVFWSERDAKLFTDIKNKELGI